MRTQLASHVFLGRSLSCVRGFLDLYHLCRHRFSMQASAAHRPKASPSYFFEESQCTTIFQGELLTHHVVHAQHCCCGRGCSSSGSGSGIEIKPKHLRLRVRHSGSICAIWADESQCLALRHADGCGLDHFKKAQGTLFIYHRTPIRKISGGTHAKRVPVEMQAQTLNRSFNDPTGAR